MVSNKFKFNKIALKTANFCRIQKCFFKRIIYELKEKIRNTCNDIAGLFSSNLRVFFTKDIFNKFQSKL